MAAVVQQLMVQPQKMASTNSGRVLMAATAASAASSSHQLLLGLAASTSSLLMPKTRSLFSSCAPSPETCPVTACNKKKVPFWRSWLFGSGGDKQAEEEKAVTPAKECCRMKFYAECKEDPDLSSFGGRAYRTCGTAYIVQKDMLPQRPSDCENKESKLVRQLEIHPDLKDVMEDPLSHLESVSARLVEMNDRRLHPMYNYLRSVPKRAPKISPAAIQCYKHLGSGPIELRDIPLNIKFNKALLERKNLYSEYKRVEPPRDLLGKLVEIRRNQVQTLERPLLRPPCGSEMTTGRMVEEARKQHRSRKVYDSLSQTAVLV